MQQLSFLNPLSTESVVNVATVPQRSPFRYPGGKTWLVPHVRRWLVAQLSVPTEFVEPFVGGGIVSLTVAFERLVPQVTMVELDHAVAAVWHTLLGDAGDWLAERIATFELTADAVDRVLARSATTVPELAFQTILKNRVNHGGILAHGAGRIRHGENGKGLASRWYPQTLKRRMLDIITIRERIHFVEGDGLALLGDYVDRPDAVYFIDPPYTAGGKRAGRRLYTHNDLDHEALFRRVSELAGDFLMTYDNASEIRALARDYNFDTQPIAMKNTHHAAMTELLIGRCLDWIRR